MVKPYEERELHTTIELALHNHRLEKSLRKDQEQRHQEQKLEVLGTLAGGMAGEFNNLLTGVLGNVGVVLSNLPKSDANRSFLVTAERAARQAADLIKQLLAFSGRTKLQLAIIDLNDVIPKTVTVLRGVLGATIAIDFRPDPGLSNVRADVFQMNEVLVNLCLNARDAMPGGGRILIETTNVRITRDSRPNFSNATPGEYACIRVSDIGHGVPRESRSRLFEPFFTTKKPGNGSGLGLALIFGIVQLHGGWVECSCDVKKGTRFDVYLPRSFEATASANNEPRV